MKQPDSPENKLSLGFNTLSPQMAEAVNYPRWIVNYFTPWIFGNVLEVGIGFANYRQHYRCEKYVGADIDPEIIEVASQQHTKDKFFTADMNCPGFQGVALENCEQGFDSVLSFNSLQYVDDEFQSISNLLSVLRPGGYLCILVPAFQCLFGPLDVDAGHRYRYERKQLQGYIDSKLGQIIHLRYFNCLAAVGWLASNIMRKRFTAKESDTVNENSSILIFDKYFLPLAKLLQPVTQHTFGLSHALVLKRL